MSGKAIMTILFQHQFNTRSRNLPLTLTAFSHPYTCTNEYLHYASDVLIPSSNAYKHT